MRKRANRRSRQFVADSRAGAQVDDREKQLRLARLEALAAAVERWLADPRYVTEQMMINALREVERRL